MLEVSTYVFARAQVFLSESLGYWLGRLEPVSEAESHC